MNVLEKEIEDLIWEAISTDRKLLTSRGLHIPEGKFFRQVPLGSYGIADMVSIAVYPHSINVRIYELKKDVVDIGTLGQAVRYAKAIRQIIYRNNINRDVDFSICLIGKSIQKNSNFCYFPDIINNLSIYTYRLDLANGLRFHNEYGYSLVKEELPDKKFSLSDIKGMIFNIDLPF